MVEHRWCVVKHLLLAARYLEEAFEYALLNKNEVLANKIEPAYRAAHAGAIQALKDFLGINDDYLAYHVAHAMMELLEAEVHAAESVPEVYGAIRKLRAALIRSMGEGVAGGERGAGEAHRQHDKEGGGGAGEGRYTQPEQGAAG